MMADKQKIFRLLKTARGQIDGIIRMAEENRYCYIHSAISLPSVTWHHQQGSTQSTPKQLRYERAGG